MLNACAQLRNESVEIGYAPVGADGAADPGAIRALLRPETVLISVMHANNEIGVIQPLVEIGRLARAAGVLFHSDGVQGAGRIPLRMDDLGVDLYSISGHKMYAPKGCGALFVRNGVPIQPLLFGGRHERDRRPGTENVASAVALGRAAQWFLDHLGEEAARVAQLRDRLEEGILRRVPRARVNGSRYARIPNTSNICFEGIEGEAMLIALDLGGFAVSTGSACTSGATAPSHVLTAIGCCKEDARASIRFSLGRSNTASQVDALIEAVSATAARLRQLSPAYA